jgi:type VI secretion system protein ImpA
MPAEPVAETSADAPPDPWTVALDLVQGGRTAEAIELIRRAMATAATGRERFHRKLQLAELCLTANRPHVALPLSEDLARQVDEFRLEEWESEQLCARVWAAFYRCLRTCGAGNGSSERLQQIFARLCRLDVNQALTFGADASGH